MQLWRLKETVRPHEILLVVDATGRMPLTWQLPLTKLGVDGIILTKLDGDTRGGAALSTRAVTGKPIKFAGLGEKLNDLEPFTQIEWPQESGHG